MSVSGTLVTAGVSRALGLALWAKKVIGIDYKCD